MAIKIEKMNLNHLNELQEILISDFDSVDGREVTLEMLFVYSHCNERMLTLFVTVLVKNINVINVLYLVKL